MAHPLDDADDCEDLFSAVRHLGIAGYECALVIMGTGRAERQLRKLLTALDLLQTVTIVPRLRPWRSVLAAGDIFIQPRPSIAFSPLLLEAMSVGLAVAACKGGVDDLIIEEQTAAVFDQSDELSIRGCLQRLFDRPDFARKLARGAQSYLRANHSVSNMISATVQAYHQAQQWFGQTSASSVEP
jgi:glycosyltransferase involved in cell wall biosynthesis